MKVLLLDIETRPNMAYVWGLWDQSVGLPQLIESAEMMCFAAKWLGDKRVEFWANRQPGDRILMIEAAHALLDEADAVMGWNSKSFDSKHLNREFLQAGLTPPSPYKHIDLMLTAKKKFKFPSNKLQYVSTLLGAAGKTPHTGFDLWLKCMAGDDAAWGLMKKYNIQDVKLLEDVYNRLLPWIDNHPNLNLYDTDDEQHLCPRCGSGDLIKQGFAFTSVSRFQQWQCKACGGWSRSGKRELGSDVRESA